MKLSFQKTEFLSTIGPNSPLPYFNNLPEVAVSGRSNCGKSTLLNHLFRSKKLVRTSAVPGKTQTIQFFCVDNQIIFADLPGYGYAKVPHHEQQKWNSFIEPYLSTRPSLILFLLDIRRTPNQQDRLMFDWINNHSIPTIIVLTKSDKLKLGEQKRQTDLILETFPHCPFVLYSAFNAQGRNELIRQINNEYSFK